MDKRKPSAKEMKGVNGCSYGPAFPVRFTGIGNDNWVVYNFRTGFVYAYGLESWEAPGRCMAENARLGKPCIPDIAAIDSTP